MISGPAVSATMTQTIDAKNYQNQEVQLRGMVQAVPSDGGQQGAGCFLRVVRPKGQRGFSEDTANRPIQSTDWMPCEISGRVDADAESLSFGADFRGAGRAWFDNFQLSVRNSNGQWRPIPITNSSFEDADSENKPSGWNVLQLGHRVRTVAVSSHGGKSALIESVPLSEGDFSPIGWSPDGTSVYAFNRDSATVVLIPASGGVGKKLFALPWPKPFAFETRSRPSDSTLTMTPDARSFVFPVGESQSDAWIIDNFDPDVR